MSKRLLSGDGWSFEPAGANKAAETVSLPDDKQSARVTLEKRAKGKEVTVVSGFTLSPADSKVLSAALKKACGAGGGVGDGTVEIQGDHRQKVEAVLRQKGWRIR